MEIRASLLITARPIERERERERGKEKERETETERERQRERESARVFSSAFTLSSRRRLSTYSTFSVSFAAAVAAAASRGGAVRCGAVPAATRENERQRALWGTDNIHSIHGMSAQPVPTFAGVCRGDVMRQPVHWRCVHVHEYTCMRVRSFPTNGVRKGNEKKIFFVADA